MSSFSAVRKPQRPASVLVIGIVNIILGVLGLICTACMGFGQLSKGNPNDTAIFGKEIQDAVEFATELETTLNNRYPFLPIITIAELGIWFFFAVVLIITGIGLISGQSWARYLALVYALLSILDKIVDVGIAVFRSMAIKEVLPDILQRHPSWNEVASGTAQNVLVQDIFTAIVCLVYPIVVFAILVRPSVGAALRGDLPAGSSGDDGWGEQPQRGSQSNDWDRGGSEGGGFRNKDNW